MKSKKTSFLFNSRNKDESKMEASTRESGFPGRRRSRYTHTTRTSFNWKRLTAACEYGHYLPACQSAILAAC